MANNKNTKVPNVPNSTDKGNTIRNVPHLRFPEFTEEWERKRFKDVCNITTGNKNTQDKSDNGIYPFYVRSKIVERINSWTFDGEAILTAGDGVGVGKVFHYSTGKIGVHQRVYILSDFKCDGKYLYSYFAGNFYNRVKRMSAKNSVDSVRMEMIADMPISLPSNEEQKKIGHLLALLDERIATQNKIIERYESLIRGLNNTLQYDTGGKSVCLGDILLERSERSRTNNQHEVLSSTVKGIFSQREYFSKDIASENNVGYKIIRLHDVVLSPQNLWMGNINYNDRFEIGIVSPSYKVFSIANGYDNQFVAAMLKTHRALYSYMMVSEQGASIVRRNLNMEAFSQLVFKIPSLDKQREIGYAISLLKSQLKTANKLIKAYTSQKQYLLRQMFI